MKENKPNIQYLQDESMQGIYIKLKELDSHVHSINIQRDGDMFCCIALTGPREVVITSFYGNHAYVNEDGYLHTI
jgi:hypothetical protein